MAHKIISFVLSESSKVKKGEKLLISLNQSAPHYFGTSVPQQYVIDRQRHKVHDQEVEFVTKAYLPAILLVEAAMEVKDIFSDEVFEIKENLLNICHEIIKKQGGSFEFSEEYSIGIVADYKGDPEQFFKYKDHIAGFLKSEKSPLDPQEVERTLTTQLKYGKNDLVIVDWDGAFIFDPEGEFASMVELLQIANFQLLKSRILDHVLGGRLETIGALQEPTSKVFIFKTKEISMAFKKVIKARSASILEFEALERDIKMIGDWYSARLYDLCSKKFHLDEWKSSIKNKLDSLEDIYTIISENFSLSWQKMANLIETVGWLILLAGYFILFYFEFTSGAK